MEAMWGMIKAAIAWLTSKEPGDWWQPSDPPPSPPAPPAPPSIAGEDWRAVLLYGGPTDGSVFMADIQRASLIKIPVRRQRLSASMYEPVLPMMDIAVYEQDQQDRCRYQYKRTEGWC